MLVKFLDETYECIEATKTVDSVTLVSTDGNIINFYGVSNFDAFVIEDGNWSNLPDSETSVEQQIVALKEQLSSTDYKIIKCSEAQLVGEELPYDIVALHAERQAIRDQINELERSGN